MLQCFLFFFKKKFWNCVCVVGVFVGVCVEGCENASHIFKFCLCRVADFCSVSNVFLKELQCVLNVFWGLKTVLQSGFKVLRNVEVLLEVCLILFCNFC